MFPEFFNDAYMYAPFESNNELDERSEEFKKAVIKSLGSSGLSPEIFGYTEEDLKMGEYEDEKYIE
jgi:hypothetical protein